jgi:hypothetical protein
VVLAGLVLDHSTVQGIGVNAPKEVVKKSIVSRPTTGNPPSAGPTIDWNATACPAPATNARPGWVGEFANGIGQSGDPNAKIRIKI